MTTHLEIKFTILLALLSVGAAVTIADDTGMKRPRVVAPQTSYDFGVVDQGSKVTNRFEILNNGDADLKIERIVPACGCTAAIVASDTIKPQSSTEMQITFDTAGFQGEKEKLIRIYTNDPDKPSTVFLVRGKIKPDVEASATLVDFGDVIRGETPSRSITIASDQSKRIALSELSTSSSAVIANGTDFSSGGKTGKNIQISIAKDAPVGLLRERVSVKSSSTANPVVNVAVLARVVGDLKLTPPAVSFGLIESATKLPVIKEVAIESLAKSGRVSVSSASSDNQLVSAEIVDATDPKAQGSQVVRITATRETRGVFRARIKLTTNSSDPNQTELTIPVYGIVAKE
jgi:hypothetical protein